VDPPRALVEIEGLSKQFGAGESRVVALDEVSLRVFAGETVGLLGPSGSGKSTLLNIIGCILEPTSGKLWLDGDLVYEGRWLRQDLRRLRLEKIGFIFQFHNLLSFLDATENISLVPQLFGVSEAKATARALELLSYLDVVHRKDAMPSQLSGGEAQRVAIARALANHPRIILADEPTAALDSERAGKVMDLLRKIAQEQQAAILVVTHDEKVFNRFDRIFHLRDGKMQELAERRAEKKRGLPQASDAG
jgi:putative ABC transport system ATP-binding protein